MSREVSKTRFEGAAPILSVKDMSASVRYYVNVLGFRNADWGTEDFTSALYQEYRVSGAKTHGAPRNYPWALEMHVEDPDGHVLRFGSEPLADQPFESWAE